MNYHHLFPFSLMFWKKLISTFNDNSRIYLQFSWSCYNSNVWTNLECRLHLLLSSSLTSAFDRWNWNFLRCFSKRWDLKNVCFSFYSWCVQPELSLIKHGQKVRTVLKSWDPEVFKTVLTFDFWPLTMGKVTFEFWWGWVLWLGWVGHFGHIQ